MDFVGSSAPITTPARTKTAPTMKLNVICSSVSEEATMNVDSGISTKIYAVPDAVHLPRTNRYKKKTKKVAVIR